MSAARQTGSQTGAMLSPLNLKVALEPRPPSCDALGVAAYLST